MLLQQPQRILVLQDEEQLNKLSGCAYGWNAPVIMIVCYDKNISWKRKYDNKDEGIVDAAIVSTHMMLEIENLGLGTTWIGSFDPEKVRDVYSIPEHYEIVALLPVGYKAEDSKANERHFERNAIEEFVFFDKIS